MRTKTKTPEMKMLRKILAEVKEARDDAQSYLTEMEKNAVEMLNMNLDNMERLAEIKLIQKTIFALLGEKVPRAVKAKAKAKKGVSRGRPKTKKKI